MSDCKHEFEKLKARTDYVEKSTNEQGHPVYSMLYFTCSCGQWLKLNVDILAEVFDPRPLKDIE